MSYATKKGYTGEVEVAEFLTKELPGFEFMRVGGVEKQKKIFGGDVVLNPKKCKPETCVLHDYLLEVKKHGTMDFWGYTDKARDDAAWHGKRNYILFAILQKKGVMGPGASKKLVAMDWSTFAKIIHELQGYRNDEREV